MLSSATKIRVRISAATGHGSRPELWRTSRQFSSNHARSMDSSFARVSTSDGCQSGERQSHDRKERSGCPSKATGNSGRGTMAKSLVKTVMSLSHVKEEVYGALDKWAAFELKFPLEATMNGLRRLRDSNQWHRVIQVSKWMLSKGVGKTNGTYSLLLRAYCMEGRFDDAEALWEKVLALNDRSMPKIMFSFMTHIYSKHEMPEKVIKVFEQMESFGIKPDAVVLRKAREAYNDLGIEEKQEELSRKHPLNSKLRRNERRIAARKALKASNKVLPVDKEKSDRACKDINIALDHGSCTKMQSPPLRSTLGNATEAVSASEVIESETIRCHDKKKSSSSRKSPSTDVQHRKRKVADDNTSESDSEFIKQIIATM